MPLRWITILCLGGFIALRAFAGNSVISSLPSATLPGSTIVVTETVTADQSAGVYSVEESVPPGWQASIISHSGRFDGATGKVKWGPFFDHFPRLLTFSLSVPQPATGDVVFTGSYSFDGVTAPIAGNRTLHVISAADANQSIRSLPAEFHPGSGVTVTIVVQPATNVFSYAVADVVPKGWSVSRPSTNDAGVYDAGSGTIRWGPFLDHLPRSFSYIAISPLGASVSNRFVGQAAFNGQLVPILGQSDISPAAGSVVRQLPSVFQPGIAFTVSLAVIPSSGTHNYALEDLLPEGWTAERISDGGQFDSFNREVKWGPFFDSSPRTVTYLANPPSGAQGSADFEGRGSFDSATVPVAGSNSILATVDTVTASLPVSTTPGSVIAGSWRATPELQTKNYAIEEVLPPGWMAEQLISDRGEVGNWDATTGKLKWGPFFDNLPRTLTAVLHVPVGNLGVVEFTGSASFDTRLVQNTGDSNISVIAETDASQVVRTLPTLVHGGGAIPVTLTVVPAPNVKTYAVEDLVPKGWQVVSISDGGSYDSYTGKLKWGPYFDSQARNLNATLQVPAMTAGVFTFAGSAAFNGVPIPFSGVATLTVFANANPVARDDSYERAIGQGVAIPVANLLGNDSDANGDALTIINLPTASRQGAGLALAAGAVVYSPPPFLHGTDSFIYTIGDGYGGQSSALVNISESSNGPSQNVKSVTVSTGGGIALVFNGVPGLTYRIQAATALSAPVWEDIGSQTAGNNGEFDFVDPDAANHPNRYYRTIFP